MSTMTREDILTKDYFESRLDAHMAAQKAHIDKLFDEHNAKLDHNFRFMIITQFIIIAAVVWPYVERLMSL